MASYTDIQDAFALWAIEGADLDDTILDADGEEITLFEALKTLIDDEDVMPNGACDALHIPAGSTYGEGVAAVVERL